MWRATARAVAGMGLALGFSGTGWGQSFGPPQQGGASAPAGSAPTATVGGLVPGGSAYTNPYANPMMNPFMNPYMSQYPVNSGDSLMYFMAAQQARAAQGAAALNSQAAGATSGPMAVPAPAPGQAARATRRQGPGQGLTARRVIPQAPASPAARESPSISRGYVAGRYNDFSQFNDSYGRLSSRYAAYGAVMTDDQTGGVAVPGLCPAPNQGPPGCFNRYPSYSQNNRR